MLRHVPHPHAWATRRRRCAQPKAAAVRCAALLALALAGVGCGDGPALLLTLQLAEGEALDTSSLASLHLRVQGFGADAPPAETFQVPLTRERQTPVAVEQAPRGELGIVAHGCDAESPSECLPVTARVVGCAVEPVAPGPNPQAVFLLLFDVANPPDVCRGLLP